MKLISLHQRLVDIVQQADADEKLSWAVLVSIANHLVEAGVDIEVATDSCSCGCDWRGAFDD